MIKRRFAAAVFTVAAIMSISARAYGSGDMFTIGSSSGTGNSKTRFAVYGGYYLYDAEVSIGSASTVNASGNGYVAGFELQSTSSKPKGVWILGVNYAAYEINLSPNNVAEKDFIRAIEVPVSWGFNLGPHFLLSLGLKARYELDPIVRESGGTKTNISHREYGIGATQLDWFGSFRFLQNIGKKPRVFLEFKYAKGVFDRALGEGDGWRDGNMGANLGFILF